MMARQSELELPPLPSNERELDALLAAPSAATVRALVECPGDVVILGAGGKMGPTLARMLRDSASRAMAEDGLARRVVAVSRFSSPEAERQLREGGLETAQCDLADRRAVARLPDAANVFFLAGQKFGTTEAPAATWGANTVVPGIVADRYPDSRIVAFSTGNVYPLVPVASGGARESDPVGPVGEYASSCLGRERVLEWFSERHGTRMAIIRLNYAVALRYGVLTDIAQRVYHRQPIDLRMGFANVIWQGDANRAAIECLAARRDAALRRQCHGAGGALRAVRRPAVRRDLRADSHLRRRGSPGRTVVIHGARDADADAAAMPLDWMISATADWVGNGRPLLGKPTSFERRDGSF